MGFHYERLQKKVCQEQNHSVEILSWARIPPRLRFQSYYLEKASGPGNKRSGPENG